MEIPQRKSAPYKKEVTGLILAGGKSRRMGTDKVFLDVGGQTMVERAVWLLEPFVSHTIIVTNQMERMSQIDFGPHVTVIEDAYPYQGPLGGLATGAACVETAYLLARAVDMPWLDERLVGGLWSLKEDYDAVVPLTARGTEPLCTLYRAEAVKRWAQPVLDTGRRRVISFFPHIMYRELPIEVIHEWDPYEISFMNINHPGQYRLVADELAEKRLTMPGDPGSFAQAVLDLEEHSHQGGYTPITPTKLPPPRIHEDEHPAYRIPLPDKHGRPIRVRHNKPGAKGVPAERPVTIFLNEVEIASVQATMRNLEDMAVGFLVSEGLLRDRDKFVSAEVDRKHAVVYVTSDELAQDELVSATDVSYITSGCGKGVTFSKPEDIKGYPPARDGIIMEPSILSDFISEMSARSESYKDTGGSHSCGIVIDGVLALVREDVGRHNAADKVIGRAWLNRLALEDAVLLSTGRLSYEIAAKAARHGIQLIASRSAATDLAISIAEAQNITLAGYVKAGQIVIYTHPQRIVGGLRSIEDDAGTTHGMEAPHDE